MHPVPGSDSADQLGILHHGIVVLAALVPFKFSCKHIAATVLVRLYCRVFSALTSMTCPMTVFYGTSSREGVR
jgi:hypothetical protein